MITRLLAVLLPGLLLSQPGAQATEPTPAQLLHVMLQGKTASEMQALVSAQDGELTHYLPIINAVGARLTHTQLNAILDSGQVGRFIDDLSINSRPEQAPEEDPSCNVGGALEFTYSSKGVSWGIYNKQADPVRLERLTATWPARLGKVSAARLGETRLPQDTLDSGSAGHLTIDVPKDLPLVLNDAAELELLFAGNPASGPTLEQRDFNIELQFSENCQTSTVPGYADNSSDFYYSTVAGADNLHQHGIRGQGITVAVLDSGLWEHAYLAQDSAGKNRVLARYDAILGKEVNEAFDESGHGTHLTSVLAHSGATLHDGQPSGSYKGIAPDSNLVVVKAFNQEGQGEMLDIVRGVQWAVDNREKYDIRVLNLSFASRPRWPYWLDPINQAVMRAWAEGVVVIAAAGNEGPEAMSIGSPGNLPYIITVGAITDSWTPTDRSDDYIPDFSSRGPTPDAHIKPDIVAPGGHITGITRPGSSLSVDHPNYMLPSGDFVMTGSSQAAALVSGLTALLLQLEPDLTPDQIKCKLTSSAEPAINADSLLAYSPFQQGSGQVNIVRAITLGEKACGNTDLDIYSDMAGERHFEGPATIDDAGNVSLPGLQDMLSPVIPEKGPSDTRIWGVKAHVERLDPNSPAETDAPFNWQLLYDQEKNRMERLESGAAR